MDYLLLVANNLKTFQILQLLFHLKLHLVCHCQENVLTNIFLPLYSTEWFNATNWCKTILQNGKISRICLVFSIMPNSSKQSLRSNVVVKPNFGKTRTLHWGSFQWVWVVREPTGGPSVNKLKQDRSSSLLCICFCAILLLQKATVYFFIPDLPSRNGKSKTKNWEVYRSFSKDQSHSNT